MLNSGECETCVTSNIDGVECFIVPSIVLSALHEVIHLICRSRGKYYYDHLHLMEEEIEAQRG